MREGIIIVDAGGGTLDLSAYRKIGGGASGGWSFEEIAPIECKVFTQACRWCSRLICCLSGRLQGSIFVTRRARAYLKGIFLFLEGVYPGWLISNSDRLSGTRFVDDIQHISEVFDVTTKLGFRDRASPYHIRFGGTRDTERAVDIRSGQMKLSGCVYQHPPLNLA